MFTAFGSILVFSVVPYYSYYVSTYIGIALSTLFTASVLTIPESPLYYILKGNYFINFFMSFLNLPGHGGHLNVFANQLTLKK